MGLGLPPIQEQGSADLNPMLMAMLMMLIQSKVKGEEEEEEKEKPVNIGWQPYVSGV